MSPQKKELENRINDFSSVIESYLSLSKGPAFQTVVAEESKLHQTRSKAIREINEAIVNESEQGVIDLLTIKSEIRKASIKAVEFLLRGESRDLENGSVQEETVVRVRFYNGSWRMSSLT